MADRMLKGTDTCPHGHAIKDCDDRWCINRWDDFLHGSYAAKPLGDTETVNEARRTRSSKPFRAAVEEIEGLSLAADPEQSEDMCTCGASWTGSRPAHCPSCHVTFGSDTGFDKHRYGKFSPPGNRKCRDTEWMTGKGWHQDQDGIWRLPAPETNPFSKEK